MNKIIKLTLCPQNIDIINNTDCEGVEIQLIGDEDFSLFDGIKKKLVTIHYPLATDVVSEVEEEMFTDLFQILKNRKNHLKSICAVAEKHHCGIVVHSYLNWLRINSENYDYENFIADLKEIHNEYPHVKLCVENTGTLSYSERFDIFTRAEDIPRMLRRINADIGYELCHPLLDITHYYMEFSSEVWNHFHYSLAETIELYKSSYQCIHFNYGLGDCNGKRHSKNFDTNPKLLDELLRAIKVINENAYLILEICEDDYDNRPEMFKLLEDIQKWEKGEFK